MVHVKNGLLTQMNGRLRGLVFFTRGEQTYARTRPQSVSDPQTPLQMQQRNRMRDVVAFYMIIRKSPLFAIWQCVEYSQRMSRMNYFVQLNIAAFSGDGHITDYEKLHFSCGSLPQGDCFDVSLQISGKAIDVHWKNETLLNQKRYTDRFMSVVVYEQDEFTIISDSGFRRRDTYARIRLTEEHPPPVRLYCFFGAADGKAYSADICCPIKR